jgi:hypothetical protein
MTLTRSVRRLRENSRQSAGDLLAAARQPNRYEQIIEQVFFNNYDSTNNEAIFERSEFKAIAQKLGITLPDNLGDVLYSFRYRYTLPPKVLAKQPAGKEWVIFPAGQRPSRYRFAAVPTATITPTAGMSVTKVPDATPGMIEMYALSDEQALLAKLRYNRLLDIYSGVTTYSLQSHLRTTIPESQVETDEIYVGVDRHGAHFVFPIQAKGGRDFLSVVQIWQDFKVCQKKFPGLIPRPIGAQFMADDVIAIFAFEWDGGDGITIAAGGERHYKLVSPSQLTPVELATYAASVPAP